MSIITLTDEFGQNHELPKLTLKLQAKMDAASNSADDAKVQYDFLSTVFSGDKGFLEDALGGKKLDDIDIIALHVLSLNVQMAYQRPLLDATKAATEEQRAALGDLGDIMKLAEQAKSRNNRQAFRPR